MVCEVCGSTELMKENGVFICQNCGCKYSLEEAKKIIIEVDGPVEVHGEVKIDKSLELENYKVLMEEAYEAGNKSKEVYEYCEKILQIDNKNSRAWLLKGISAGWLSSQDNVRFKETVMCFKNALAFIPENKKEDLIKTFEKDYENMGRRVSFWVGKQYMSLPNDFDRANNTINAYSNFIDSSKELNEVYGTSFDLNRLLDWYFDDLIIICDNAMKKAKQDFGLEAFNRPKSFSEYNYQVYINTSLNNVNIYRGMVVYVNNAIDLIELKYKITITLTDLISSYSTDSNGRIDRYLSYESKKVYSDNLKKYCGEIDEKIDALNKEMEAEIKAKEEAERKAKEEAQKAANEKYWNEHSDLKKQLTDEAAMLNEKIKNINSELNDIYESINTIKDKKYDSNIYSSQINDQKAHIADLNSQLSKLSLFKMKEKKELNSQIDDSKANLKKLEGDLQNDIQKFEKEKISDIAPLEAEVNKKKAEIDNFYSRLDEIQELFNKNY